VFQPDYQHIVDAASNRAAKRQPLYEHVVNIDFIERVLGKPISHLSKEGASGRKEYLKEYCRFYYEMGYDTVSYEICIGPSMPGSGCLGGHKDGVIKTREDFEKYPWAEIPDLYFTKNTDWFRTFAEVLPAGMKGIGGVGNGIFECVQEIVGYMDLCYIREDDPELYADLFKKVGETNLIIWKRFLAEFADSFCVMRFGDDLGFKSATLLPEDDIRQFIIPAYKGIIDAVHSYGKKFLLHSCGNIFGVMEDLIAAGIDAKHSNEDIIAPFTEWVNRYGNRIGNFGGIDASELCLLDTKGVAQYVTDVLHACEGHGGIAFSTGNSVPGYIPTENYLAMIEAVRQYRGE